MPYPRQPASGQALAAASTPVNLIPHEAFVAPASAQAYRRHSAQRVAGRASRTCRQSGCRAVRCLPLHHGPTPGQVRDLEKYAATVRRVGDETRELAAAHGMDEERVVGEYGLAQQIEDRMAAVENAQVNHKT